MLIAFLVYITLMITGVIMKQYKYYFITSNLLLIIGCIYLIYKKQTTPQQTPTQDVQIQIIDGIETCAV